MIPIKTTYSKARFSRRGFLGALGATSIMLPLLDGDESYAQAGGFPKRLITIAWGNGIPRSRFYPKDDTTPTASDVLEPLSALQSKVLLVAGVDLKVMLDDGRDYDGHFSYPTLYTATYRNVNDQTGTATGPSVDQVVSDAIAEKVALPMPLLTITVEDRSTSYRGDDQRNTGEREPGRLFDQLFTGANLSTDQLELLRTRRQSVLDFVGQDLEAFGTRMGAEDRLKVQGHLESIRQLELRLSASAANCEPPMADTGAEGYPERLKALNAITAMAIRCDMTRSVSMVWSADGGSNPRALPWTGVSGEYHGIAHDGEGAYDRKVPIDRWYYEQVADLAQQLEDTAELGATALDNSVIVVGNDMNEGSKHNVGGLGFTLIGSGGGHFRTGRVVRLGEWANKAPDEEYYNDASGVPNNQLLASLCNAMGVPKDSFGQNYSGTLDGELT